jgi:hypothetical protein
MTAEDLEAIGQVVRAELRRCGLRPPTPPEPGVWRWDAGRDEWVPVPSTPEAATSPPENASARRASLDARRCVRKPFDAFSRPLRALPERAAARPEPREPRRFCSTRCRRLGWLARQRAEAVAAYRAEAIAALDEVADRHGASRA